MTTIITGVIFLILAIAGFILVPEHRPPSPTDTCAGWGIGPCPGVWRLSHPAYDAARITTWAVVVVGAITVALGIISYARRDTAETQSSTRPVRAS